MLGRGRGRGSAGPNLTLVGHPGVGARSKTQLEGALFCDTSVGALKLCAWTRKGHERAVVIGNATNTGASARCGFRSGGTGLDSDYRRPQDPTFSACRALPKL